MFFTLDVAFQELEEKGRKAFDDAAKHGNDLAAMHAAQVRPRRCSVASVSFRVCVRALPVVVRQRSARARMRARMHVCVGACTCARVRALARNRARTFTCFFHKCAFGVLCALHAT